MNTAFAEHYTKRDASFDKMVEIEREKEK